MVKKKKYEITEVLTNTYVVEARDEDEAYEKLDNWECKQTGNEKEYNIEELDE